MRNLFIIIAVIALMSTVNAQEKSDTMLVSRAAVEAQIRAFQTANAQDSAAVEALRADILSPAFQLLTGKERLQRQLQLENALETIMQRNAVIWAWRELEKFKPESK